MKNIISGISKGMQKMNSTMPVVSIIIPAWNEEKNIARTLSSLADQKADYPVELIVVNNNSTDDTQKILDSCGVKTVFEPRQSIPVARQTGLERASGKYILCADSDSIYPESWVNTMVSHLQKKDITVVCGGHSFIPSKNCSRFQMAIYEYISQIVFKLRTRKKPYLNAMGYSLGFHRELALEVGGFDATMHRGSDGRLAFNLAQKGNISMIACNNSRIWTGTRRLAADGGLAKAFMSRVWKEIKRINEHI